MTTRLRHIAPSKPLGVEVCADPNVAYACGGSVCGKSAWITDYFAWLHANDIRMTKWFNGDYVGVKSGERDWTVIGGPSGDETFTYMGKSYNAWSAYRVGFDNSWVVGSDPTNEQLLTDTQFLGR